MSFVPFENPITPKKRLNYAGPVVMVLDGLSASASVSFAAWFVRSGRGKTIGEPPMGGISGTFGNPVRLTLPSSKLQFNVAYGPLLHRRNQSGGRQNLYCLISPLP
jgi:C-terminal processing protease CtpA/Prc